MPNKIKRGMLAHHRNSMFRPGGKRKGQQTVSPIGSDDPSLPKTTLDNAMSKMTLGELAELSAIGGRLLQ